MKTITVSEIHRGQMFLITPAPPLFGALKSAVTDANCSMRELGKAFGQGTVDHLNKLRAVPKDDPMFTKPFKVVMGSRPHGIHGDVFGLAKAHNITDPAVLILWEAMAGCRWRLKTCIERVGGAFLLCEEMVEYPE